MAYLNVVRHLAAVADAALEIPRAGEVPGTPGKEDEVEGAAIVVELTLDEGAMDNGEDPVKVGDGLGTLLELAGEEKVPRLCRWLNLWKIRK